MKTAVFLYEPAHVGLLSSLPACAPGEDRVLIACGADIEFLLEEKGAPFFSARSLRTTPVSERLQDAGRIGRVVREAPPLSVFSYRGVDLRSAFAPALQYYLAVFFYHLDIVAEALRGGSYDNVVVFASAAGVARAGGLLAGPEARTFVDAAGLACAQKNIPCVVLEVPRAAPPRAAFELKRRMLGWGIWALNTTIAVLVPRKKMRIVASELWKNIGPFMDELKNSELVLLDRAEAPAIGFSSIVRHRMQFVHTQNFVSRAARRAQAQALAALRAGWEEFSAVHHVFSDAQFRGHSLEGLLQKTMAHIVDGAQDVLDEIDGTYALYERTSPDIVLVRAGASAQTHFLVLCEVARLLGIPSLEIQHGSFYFGPESLSKERSAQYVAEYGPLVRQDLKGVGYTDGQLFDVGSPRFDLYKQATSEAQTDRTGGVLNVVCIAPRVTQGFWTDSYDVLDYFGRLAAALREVEGCAATIKLRPAAESRDFYAEALRRSFGAQAYRVAQYEPLVDLFARADAIVSCYSTAFIEALLSGKPTVYFLADMPAYGLLARAPENAAAIKAGALIVAPHTEELVGQLRSFKDKPHERTLVAERARVFMESNYSFDGKSAMRLAEVVRTLAEKPKQATITTI